MATTQSSSPSDSTQFFIKPLPVPAHTTTLCLGSLNAGRT